MQVKFWGTRGSLPRATTHQDLEDLLDRLVDYCLKKGVTSLKEFKNTIKDKKGIWPLDHGGDTSCVQISSNKTKLYVDMGSGIRNGGTVDQNKGDTNFNILLTHMHWDHVIGLPFFRPVYSPNSEINIYHSHENTEEFIRTIFNGVNFPLKWDMLPSKLKFHKVNLYKDFSIGELKATPFKLDHPGDSFGYRIESPEKKTVSLAFDSEFSRSTREELGDDLPYYQNLDVLVFDGQYEKEELKNKTGWGHSCPEIGAEIGVREGIRNVVFTHHDPWSTEDKLWSMLEAAQKKADFLLPEFKEVWEKLNQTEGPLLKNAYDGLELKIGN